MPSSAARLVYHRARRGEASGAALPRRADLQVITGHANTPGGRAGQVLPTSPVMKWSDLQEYADFTRDLVSAARAAMAGQSVDEAVKSLKMPEKFRDYDMTNARAIFQRVYEELK